MNRNRLSVFGAVIAAAFVLASCRAEEQGRVIQFKPGVYLGKKDNTDLSEAREAELRSRARGQSDLGYIPLGGSGASKVKSDVDIGALKGRIDGQRVK